MHQLQQEYSTSKGTEVCYNHIWAIGQDGWILAKFFFCVIYIRLLNSQKKNKANIQPS